MLTPVSAPIGPTAESVSATDEATLSSRSGQQPAGSDTDHGNLPTLLSSRALPADEEYIAESKSDAGSENIAPQAETACEEAEIGATCADISEFAVPAAQEASTASVRFLCPVHPSSSIGKALLARRLELDEATFKDLRWEKALKHLQSHGPNQKIRVQDCQDLLREGAQAFGLWHLPNPSLQALTKHVLGAQPEVSSALRVWIDAQAAKHPPEHAEVLPSNRKSRTVASIESQEVKAQIENAQKTRSQAFGLLSSARKQKAVLCLLIAGACSCFVVSQCNKEIIAVFGGFLVIARWTGFATLLFTAVLFLTMSRTLLNVLYRLTPAHWRLCRVLDSHTALHIFSGQMMSLCAVLHVAAHLLSTCSAIEREPVDKLNQVLKCANEDDRSSFKEAFSSSFPPCPLQRNLSLSELMFGTTAGLSGLGLFAIIMALGFTSRSAKRHANFELFYYVHMAGTSLWLILLFVHGMQGWFGAWMPLVIPVCALPACFVAYDKIHRCVTFHCRTCDVRIISAIIRPGKDGGARGALTALKIKKPDFLWHMKDGMYALLCMPGYSSFQWHPFTIISGRESDTVDFIVSGLGNWTQELAQKVLEHHQGLSDELPVVALDGPFSAPVATALQCKVLIAVGSGIGITPFLALMTQLLAALNAKSCVLPLREAHVFWIARSADEFLFGRHHFTRIVASANVKNKIFLHLHCTGQEPPNNSPAFIFKEAVKRQSQLDRKAFLDARHSLAADSLVASPTLPWAWAHGSSCSAIWVNFICEKLAEQQETELAESCQAHWSSKSRGSFTSHASVSSLNLSCSSLDTMLPIFFGRPEWHAEIQAIGKAWPEDDVHVYVCGSDAVVDALQNVCRVCNTHSQKACRKQRFVLRRESFGS